MDQLTPVLDAISHPSRRAILARLSKGPARVTEIAEPFAMSLNAVSKHLKVLEAAGLVHRDRQGRDHVMELRAAPLRQVTQWLHPYERYWSRQLDRLEDHFTAKKRRKAK
ncbi:MAG: metalloregulator ArsR/SmtB family transcription factor [Gemmatimonadota bacterium]|nr:metalloregulator ArsR/SmtB family transcription factor [Gemmatimonadota bacterium]